MTDIQDASGRPPPSSSRSSLPGMSGYDFESGVEWMQCPSCGYPIDQQSPSHCPQCGRPLTAPADQQIAGGAPLADPGSPSPSAEPVSPSVQTPPQNPYTPYAPYTPPGQPGEYPPAPGGNGQPYGQSAPLSHPLPPSYPPPSGRFQSAYPPMGYAQPPYAAQPPAPPTQRKSRVGLIVGIVAAVVVVLAVCTCGTIFAVRSLSHSTA